MKVLMFPGQGSQKTGMGENHYQENDLFRSLVDEADQLLGYSLSDLMFNGPSDRLVQTRYTQPAIFLHSYALYRTLQIKPDLVAGHSLGEFTALAAAGVLSFESALGLVVRRGELMQEAGEAKPGTMAAIIGLEDQLVEDIREEAASTTGKQVVPAD